jgi:adenylylsulfate kinase-like enzyme
MWFTGLPSSGKTTLARAVQQKARGSVLLDSDEVRTQLFPALGYGRRDRDALYQALAELAVLLARQGLAVLVAGTANRRAYRDHARRASPRFVEVFVDTPPEECARRDAKGLYRRGVKLPGSGARYERPRRPEVVANGGESPMAVKACLAMLRQR